MGEIASNLTVPVGAVGSIGTPLMLTNHSRSWDTEVVKPKTNEATESGDYDKLYKSLSDYKFTLTEFYAHIHSEKYSLSEQEAASLMAAYTDKRFPVHTRESVVSGFAEEWAAMQEVLTMQKPSVKPDGIDDPTPQPGSPPWSVEEWEKRKSEGVSEGFNPWIAIKTLAEDLFSVSVGGYAAKYLDKELYRYYENLPRKYEKLFDAYNVPPALKHAVTVAINDGGEDLDKLASRLMKIVMRVSYTVDSEDYAANSEYNKGKHFDDYIDNQRGEDTADIRMGNDVAKNNGCGWISVYNVGRMLGEDWQPWEIIEYFDTKGGTLIQGQYGVNPEGIMSFFEAFDVDAEIDYFPDSVDERIKSSRASIVLYLHEYGGHYIATRYENGEFEAYNHNDDEIIVSFDKEIEARGWLVLAIITIR